MSKLFGDHVHFHAPFEDAVVAALHLFFELHKSVRKREHGVVFGALYVFTRKIARAALAYDDCSGFCVFAAVELDSEALTFGVP